MAPHICQRLLDNAKERHLNVRRKSANRLRNHIDINSTAPAETFYVPLQCWSQSCLVEQRRMQ
jgi:hypothetical protein